ncbi:MAG: patatin-like phospholipase family protein [Casimicrobiaceae bacterium]
MKLFPVIRLLFYASLLVLAGCATRPVNPPITHVDNAPISLEREGESAAQRQNLLILAFSGGGTRAAAFSYGVLETLRRTEIVLRTGAKVRLLDQVDWITGVSGGSFTALAYRLYGEKLFDEYEKRFLKRNVQGEIIARALNPGNWGALSSVGWGRSEMAADLYDEILFNGATFGDLQRTDGPGVAVSATDITTGSRLVFIRSNFDVVCSELGTFRLSRAAAASSAVPVVLSPLTINNYGGTCGFAPPPWTKQFLENPDPPRPAARAIKRLVELQGLASGNEPYLHLVDGGVSDNLGLRGVLDLIESFEALHEVGQKTPLDHVKRIIVFIVNSLSSPATEWAKAENGPGMLSVLIKAAGVPIDRYSGEQVEQLKDIEARWKILRQIRAVAKFPIDTGAAATMVRNAPDAELYAIDVSFPELKDKAERDYLNQLPTSFVLKDEEVDRLRAAAAKIILESPDFQRLLKDAGARVVDNPSLPASP